MDDLRRLWNFDDVDASEARFRAELDRATTPRRRSDVIAQLARVEGLRGRFGAGDALLDEAEASGRETSCTLLERGRLRRSEGDAASALPLFVSAYHAALEEGEPFLAADAAHMAALADPDEMEEWTERGVEVTLRDPEAAYWRGPLLNNLGWHRFERGDHEGALDAFTLALAAREEDPERPYEREIARYAVAKALRALGRPDEAVPLLERAVAWTEHAGQPDGWFHEELAETYADLGRHAEARTHARLAMPLLEEADAAFATNEERRRRLRTLAGI